MKLNFHVLLDERYIPLAKKKYADGDVIFTDLNIDSIKSNFPGAIWRAIDNYIPNKEECLSFQRGFYSLGDQAGRFSMFLEPAVNNVFFYIVSPMLGVVRSLSVAYEEFGFQNTIVYCLYDLDCFGVYGVRSKESRFGFFLDLGTILLHPLRRCFPEVKFIAVCSGTAILYSIRRIAAFVFGLSWPWLRSIRLKFTGSGQRRIVNGSGFLVIVRCKHHVDKLVAVVDQLKERGEKVTVFLSPQVLSNFKLLDYAKKHLLADHFVEDDGLNFSFFSSYVQSMYESAGTGVLSVPVIGLGRTVTLSWGAVVRDLSVFSFWSDFYFSLHNFFGHNSGYKALISLEQVGKQAFYEYLAAKRAGVKYIQLQAAAIQQIPLPVFGGDLQLVVSQDLVDYMRRNCSVVRGKIEHCGAIPVKHDFGDNKDRIVYFSQPHEPSENQEIVSALIDIFGIDKVFVKRHPRDSQFYRTANVYLDETPTQQAITEASLCVSRSSSVLREALQLNKTILACCLSSYDATFKADYLEDEQTKVYSILELRNALSPDGLVKLKRASNELSSRLFRGLGSRDFVSRIIYEAYS